MASSSEGRNQRSSNWEAGEEHRLERGQMHLSYLTKRYATASPVSFTLCCTRRRPGSYILSLIRSVTQKEKQELSTRQLVRHQIAGNGPILVKIRSETFLKKWLSKLDCQFYSSQGKEDATCQDEERRRRRGTRNGAGEWQQRQWDSYIR